jgi:hypothetical protein
MTHKPQPLQFGQAEVWLLLNAKGNASLHDLGEAVELTQ